MSYTITGDLLVNLRSVDGKLYNCTDNNLYKVNRTNYSATTLSSSNTKFSPSSLRIVGNVSNNKEELLAIFFKKSNLVATKFTLSFWWYQKDSLFYSSSGWYYCGIDLTSTNIKYNFSNLYFIPHLDSNKGLWYQYGGYNGNSSFIEIFPFDYTYAEEPLNTWVHYAVCRNDNTIYFFRNGNLFSSQSKQADDIFGFNCIRILRYGNTAEFYIDDLTYIENQCLWTNNFTPPTNYLTGEYTGILGKKKSVIPNYVPFYQDKTFIY